jgi:hypothetical protein
MPYKVLIDTLNHNGRKRVPGELLDMSDEDAAPLIKIGAIETLPVKVDPAPSGAGDQNTGAAAVTGGAAEQSQNGSTESGGNEAKQNTLQGQPAASANNAAVSDAPKTGKKESKPKTE